MAQRLWADLARDTAAFHRLVDRNGGRCEWAGSGSVRPQPKKQRARPRRSGDLPRNRRQRAVMRGLPREAVIEDQHLMAAALPFPQQPGPGLQLRFHLRADPMLRPRGGVKYDIGALAGLATILLPKKLSHVGFVVNGEMLTLTMPPE